MSGATVTTVVSDVFVGEALRRLEHHADVHLLDRAVDSLRGVEVWTLRSDLFPQDWEGEEVRCIVSVDSPGVSSFQRKGFSVV